MAGQRRNDVCCRRLRRLVAAVVGLVCGSISGCAGESVKLAIEAQQRADEVTQAVFDRQHEGLRVLLYRDLVTRLQSADDGAATIGDDEREVLNQVWNDRDLVEFWAIQHERAKSLRLIGVDMKLYSEQSVFELLLKQATGKLERGIAAAAGAAVSSSE